MNLKSLIKDDHWMRRIRKLVERIHHAKGMAGDDSIYDTAPHPTLSGIGFGRGIPAHLATAAPHTPRGAPTAALWPEAGSEAVPAGSSHGGSASAHDIEMTVAVSPVPDAGGQGTPRHTFTPRG